jgi:holin-like protein
MTVAGLEFDVMLRGLNILLVCQLAGEALARGLALSVPGPVIGLVLLAGGLLTAARLGRLPSDGVEATDVGRVSKGLLASLGVLFVPAGVGVVQHSGVLGAYGPALLAALIGSTVVTLIATVWTFIGVSRLLARRRADG